MLRHILFAINLLRAMPAYCAVCLSGAKKLICAETEGYVWFLETYDGDRFFLRFAWLMWRYDCYRSHVVFRCSQASTMCSYLIRLLYPPKKDMEVLGEIGEGLVIYHGPRNGDRALQHWKELLRLSGCHHRTKREAGAGDQ